MGWWRKGGMLSKLCKFIGWRGFVGSCKAQWEQFGATFRSYRLQNSELNNIARFGTSLMCLHMSGTRIILELVVQNYYITTKFAFLQMCPHIHIHILKIQAFQTSSTKIQSVIPNLTLVLFLEYIYIYVYIYKSRIKTLYCFLHKKHLSSSIIILNLNNQISFDNNAPQKHISHCFILILCSNV
jgi:hypothetical protein